MDGNGGEEDGGLKVDDDGEEDALKGWRLRRWLDNENDDGGGDDGDNMMMAVLSFALGLKSVQRLAFTLNYLLFSTYLTQACPPWGGSTRACQPGGQHHCSTLAPTARRFIP